MTKVNISTKDRLWKVEVNYSSGEEAEEVLFDAVRKIYESSAANKNLD